MTDKMTNGDNSPGDEGKERSYAIVCDLCGSDAEVPFRPRKGEDVYCQDCFKFKKTDVRRKRHKSSPRKKHGTRVSFEIICAQCDKEETLDYVPKGVSLKDALCSECVRTTYGDESRWAKVKDEKDEEQKHEWEISCVDCGREDYLKFPPNPDKEYRCVRCYHLQEAPSPERLEGKKRVGRAVYIRKSDGES